MGECNLQEAFFSLMEQHNMVGWLKNSSSYSLMKLVVLRTYHVNA